MESDLQVVGLDLTSGKTVHIDDSPKPYWQALGYGGDETLVCYHCYHGTDAPPLTRVPLVPRSRIGGSKRPHFAHPPGEAPNGGHNGETIWHLNAKTTIARWAMHQPGVARVQEERWIDDRRRRADVHITFTGGQQVALEVQGCQITDTAWLQRHRDYRDAGIVDVWLWRSWKILSQATLLDKVPPWILYPDKREIEIPIAQSHPLIGNWWDDKDPHVYGEHFPPCVGDDLTRETRQQQDFTLTPEGLQPPDDLKRRLVASAYFARMRAEREQKPDSRFAIERSRSNISGARFRPQPLRPCISDAWISDQYAYWRGKPAPMPDYVDIFLKPSCRKRGW